MGCCFCTCASLETSVVIKAPASIVYNILTDFDSYKEWNPFIIESSKDTDQLVANKTKLTNVMKPSENQQMQFTPTVTKVEANKEFEWLGILCCRGCFDGNHYFKMEASSADTTHFIQGERFYGCLIVSCICCLNPLLLNDTKRGFENMNKALKERAEQQYQKIQQNSDINNVPPPGPGGMITNYN
eukprot:222991_1